MFCYLSWYDYFLVLLNGRLTVVCVFPLAAFVGFGGCLMFCLSWFVWYLRAKLLLYLVWFVFLILICVFFWCCVVFTCLVFVFYWFLSLILCFCRLFWCILLLGLLLMWFWLCNWWDVLLTYGFYVMIWVWIDDFVLILFFVILMFVWFMVGLICLFGVLRLDLGL